jgi:hypothetical protein
LKVEGRVVAAHRVAWLAAFVADVNAAGPVADNDLYNLTVDAAVDRFLDYLREDKGREEKRSATDRSIHKRSFTDTIGRLRVRGVDIGEFDRAFGTMRAAGLSRSRMDHARSLYEPFFRWAKRRGMTLRNPMLDFEMPTSQYVSRERTPPDAPGPHDEADRPAQGAPRHQGQEARHRAPGGRGPAPVPPASADTSAGSVRSHAQSDMSYKAIGEQLDRSQRWAALAIAAAERREAARARGAGLDFDGSALRKFTSSELLDAGFNVSMVAQRQGHAPQVLTKHYAKSRRSGHQHLLRRRSLTAGAPRHLLAPSKICVSRTSTSRRARVRPPCKWTQEL